MLTKGRGLGAEALFRLVEGMSDGDGDSVAEAWETVRHTYRLEDLCTSACGFVEAGDCQATQILVAVS
jgi:hypothetical protein